VFIKESFSEIVSIVIAFGWLIVFHIAVNFNYNGLFFNI